MSDIDDTVPLSEIPTLSLLYKLNRIPLASPLSTPYTPSATLNAKISIIRQDITLLAVDAIVNAANTSLLGGGGVDGAIHRAAGPDLLAECETLDGCATGSAKITDGYELPARKVIHAVGPIYWKAHTDTSAAELLASCYRTSLEIAVENGVKSVAFSALSTGVYGYPSGEASEVALETVRGFLEERGEEVERVVFCNFMEKDESAYFGNVSHFFPPVIEQEDGETAEEEKAADDTETNQTETNATELASKLPDPPSAEPKDPAEPSSKKQKTETTEDDFVVVEKPGAESKSGL